MFNIIIIIMNRISSSFVYMQEISTTVDDLLSTTGNYSSLRIW